MDKAKQAVSDFMSGSGRHTTTVHEDHRAAVTEEHVRPTRHEEVTTAVDKEIHQDHHHTVVQPIKATERAAEKHVHNVAPVEHRTFDHDNTKDTSALLDRDAAKFKDTSIKHNTTHTISAAPTVTGEHIHHHVHEHVQPVIQKDTIVPEVVHTTIPIHEKHHAATVHHETTTMPVKTVEEFEREHGKLGDKATTKLAEYEGCPKDHTWDGTCQHGHNGSEYKKGGLAKNLRSEVTGGTGKSYEQGGLYDEKNTHTNTSMNQKIGKESMFGTQSGPNTVSTGTTTTTTTTGKPKTNDAALAGATAAAATAPAGSLGTSDYKTSPGKSMDTRHSADASVPRSSRVEPATTTTHRGSQDTTNTTTSKISLKDKLNPFKDADGDGKKGIMS